MKTILIIILILFTELSVAEGTGEGSNNNQNSQKNKSLIDSDDKKGNKKKTPSVLQTKISVAGPAKVSIASALNSLAPNDVKAIQEGLANYDGFANNIGSVGSTNFSQESTSYVKSIADTITNSRSP